jgi:hypothetical protein
MRNCDDERPGAFQWPFSFFAPVVVCPSHFSFFTWHSCVQLLFFSMYLEKDGAHSRRRRPTRARPCCWLADVKKRYFRLFIYLFIRERFALLDRPASRSLVLYFLYSLCRVLFFGEENFNVRKQHLEIFT